MTSPLFSICVIGRNEAHTFPKRLLPSIRPFIEAGGEVVFLDTGSTDNTVEVAKAAGCKVFEKGEAFLVKFDQDLVSRINKEFVVSDEAPVVFLDSRVFDYASARNHCASLASHDMVLIADCDESFTVLNIEACNALIKAGHQRLDIPYVHSHDDFGRPSTQFTRNAFYDRRVCRWAGVVHEIVVGDTKAVYPSNKEILLEHFQEASGNRQTYLAGLAYDCFQNPDKDRQRHYFARELMYQRRYLSAMRQFRHHISMPNGWRLEQGQSRIFMGDCLFYLGREQDAVREWHEAFLADGTRREPLMRLAEHFYRKADHSKAAAYANAALVIKGTPAYCNQMAYYRHVPHEILYVSLWWLGDREGSRRHWRQALAACPENPKYQKDAVFYDGYLGNDIQGWMALVELQWLYASAAKVSTVLELGSWKGRSTHALCSGCPGQVTAVDHFLGSVEERSTSHREAQNGEIYDQFVRNMAGFTNLTILRMSGKEAAAKLQGAKFDMIFVDASHKYEDVLSDLKTWAPRATKLICGHDYNPAWPGVQRAVNEVIGPIRTCGNIWFKWKV